jgi:hypothetical protein
MKLCLCFGFVCILVPRCKHPEQKSRVLATKLTCSVTALAGNRIYIRHYVNVTDLHTFWNTVFMKLTAALLLKEFPGFCGTEGPLSCPILNQLYQVCTHISYLFKIYFNISLPSTCRSPIRNCNFGCFLICPCYIPTNVMFMISKR